MATKTPKKTVKKTDTKKKAPVAKAAKKSNVKSTTTKTKASVKKAPAKKSEVKTTKKVDKKKTTVKKVDKKSENKKHPSEIIEKPKKDNNYKTLAIVTGIIMIILALIFFSLTNEEKNKEDTFFTSYDTNTVLIIEDSSCALCQVDEFALGVQAEIDSQATILRLEYSDPRAQRFIEEFNLNQVPIVLFSTSFENTDVWPQLSVAFNKVSYNENEYYQLTYNTPQIKKVLNEPEVNKKTITFGNTNSENVIYEFCSYETALCGLVNGNGQYLDEVRASAPEYKSLMPNVITENNAKVVVVHVPQEENIDAYIAAFCAEEQGKYTEFRNSLYENQFEWVPVQDRNTILTNYALQIGIDREAFTLCLENNKEMYQTQIELESQLADELNLAQFPAFVVNSYVISGPLDFDSYLNILTQ